ncbi:MAG TPA: 4-(cytidine 5'-diphospho)-2-C-methyl-D-erythritol kinase, partial [Erysipelothrix sp.]|nr:4-(cytidine 5'-diphospho)-2-C-methyl-D-erythritol kinase [Erysipelothrix sp.]
MRRKAYAKITLSLYAYRDGDTLKFKNVIVPIDLFDVVYLEKNETMEISTNKSFLPNDKRNTVYLALDILKKKYNIQDNFKVKIVKNIPAQSGLGGGSS